MIKNNWQPITKDSPIEEGDIIGGYNGSGVWTRGRVTVEMAVKRDFYLSHMIATHWTKAAPYWQIPMPPGIEDCEVMEAGF